MSPEIAQQHREDHDQAPEIAGAPFKRAERDQPVDAGPDNDDETQRAGAGDAGLEDPERPQGQTGGPGARPIDRNADRDAAINDGHASAKSGKSVMSPARNLGTGIVVPMSQKAGNARSRMAASKTSDRITVEASTRGAWLCDQVSPIYLSAP